MFQDLHQSDTIYIINRNEGVPTLKTGEFVRKSNAVAVAPSSTAGLMMGMNQQQEFTMRVRVEGQEGDFPHILTSESVHDYGNMIVTSTRELALSEIDKIRCKAQGELDRQEQNEKTVVACEEISKTLNPAYAKEKERDEAIANLSSRLDKMEETIGGSLDKILKQLNKK